MQKVLRSRNQPQTEIPSLLGLISFDLCENLLKITDKKIVLSVDSLRQCRLVHFSAVSYSCPSYFLSYPNSSPSFRYAEKTDPICVPQSICSQEDFQCCDVDHITLKRTGQILISWSQLQFLELLTSFVYF